jgi:hypothetical protein
MENLSRAELLMKLGAARSKARAAWRLIDVEVAEQDATFTFALNRDKLRKDTPPRGALSAAHQSVRRGSGQAVEVLRPTRGDRGRVQEPQGRSAAPPDLPPAFEHRIEAHILVAFLAYCLHVTLRAKLKPLTPGLTPRAALAKPAAIQMVDGHFPTTDGRTLILSRYTEPNADQKLLLKRLKLDLPSPVAHHAPVGQAARLAPE